MAFRGIAEEQIEAVFSSAGFGDVPDAVIDITNLNGDGAASADS